MAKIFLICATVILVGCASPPPIDVQVSCPPLRTWTPAEEGALAAALAPIPESSPLWTQHFDWQRMRDAIRACNAPSKS